MPRYLRVTNPGGTFFFTVVTFGRRSILGDKDSIRTLMKIMTQVQGTFPFTLEAPVVLPNHMHALWTLPDGDGNFGQRWGLIKALFSKEVKGKFPLNGGIKPSRLKRRETSIWQRRFWEHAIRDEQDFQRHLDYIHYNPVKHGLVRRVSDWPYSSFYRYVKQGIYPEDWGTGIFFLPTDSFGE